MSAPEIDHVGVIVADLDAALARLGVLFPDGAAEIRELPAAGLRVARLDAANLAIELIEYTSEAPGLGRRTMGERPGINHLSVRVADLEAATAELAAAGFEPMEGFPTEGAHGRVAFFTPDPVTGLLLELCEGR